MLWHRQAIFEWKRREVVLICWMLDSNPGSLEPNLSRLNAYWQTDWALEDQTKNLDSISPSLWYLIFIRFNNSVLLIFVQYALYEYLIASHILINLVPVAIVRIINATLCFAGEKSPLIHLYGLDPDYREQVGLHGFTMRLDSNWLLNRNILYFLIHRSVKNMLFNSLRPSDAYMRR